jgi:hypothetical protein
MGMDSAAVCSMVVENSELVWAAVGRLPVRELEKLEGQSWKRAFGSPSWDSAYTGENDVDEVVVEPTCNELHGRTWVWMSGEMGYSPRN